MLKLRPTNFNEINSQLSGCYTDYIHSMKQESSFTSWKASGSSEGYPLEEEDGELISANSPLPPQSPLLPTLLLMSIQQSFKFIHP